MRLIIPEYQPNFPSEDISEHNAEIIQISLDLQERFATHDSLKPQSYLYAFGHGEIDSMIRGNQEYIDQQIAASEGVALYETVASIVRPVHDEAVHNNRLLVLETAASLVSHIRRSYFNTTFDARDEFAEKMPRTKHLIAAKAVEFLGRDTDYAITGAALAWKLETETLSAA